MNFTGFDFFYGSFLNPFKAFFFVSTFLVFFYYCISWACNVYDYSGCNNRAWRICSAWICDEGWRLCVYVFCKRDTYIFPKSGVTQSQKSCCYYSNNQYWNISYGFRFISYLYKCGVVLCCLGIWEKILWYCINIKYALKNPQRRGFFNRKQKLFCNWTIVFADNCFFSDFSIWKFSRVILSIAKLVGSTSLKKCLLIAKNKLFIGFTVFFDRVANHVAGGIRIKISSGYYRYIDICQTFFTRKSAYIFALL